MSGRFQKYIRLSSSALIVGVSIGYASAQDVAVDINAGDITILSNSCASGPACSLALKSLIARVMAANPALSFEKVLASVVASVSAEYNTGKLSARVAKEVLGGARKEANAQGLSVLSKSISVAANAAGRGDPVDLEAVAEASASPS